MNASKQRYLFYFAWLMISIIQASCTELFHDEAYYWVYSRDLHWGYFCHPPLIAGLIRAGAFITGLHNELAVRLLMIPLNLGTIYLIERLVKPEKLILFYAILCSIIIIQLGGTLAIPDTPLLFFAALFFYLFNSYLNKENFYNTICLSLVITLLLYSKYHGILLVFFSLLANLKLFKRKSLYLLLLLSLLLYLPHLYWLYQSNFVTLNYILFDRSTKDYSILFTAEYLLTQPFVLAGLCGPLFIYSCYLFVPRSDFEKALKWNFWGMLIFFLIMTLKGRIEAHWTIICIIPMVYIVYKFLMDSNDKILKYFYRLSLITFLSVILLRIFLIHDFLPAIIKTHFEFHDQKKWTSQLKQKSNGLPVVWMDNYQKPSKYEFYTGVPAYSLNNVMGKKNQFNISETEESLQGKTIFLIPNWRVTGLDSIEINEKWDNYKIINNFRSYSKIYFKTPHSFYTFSKNQVAELKLSIINNYKYRPDFNANAAYPSFISYQFFSDHKLVSDTTTTIQLRNDMLDKDLLLKIRTPLEKGEYYLRISISTGWLPPTINSEKIKVRVI